MAKKKNNQENTDSTPQEPTEGLFGSLLPEDITSLDPSQIVDYTGTIGAMTEALDDGMVDDSLAADDSAQTRMVDDNFYKQIQAFFPAAESSSGSGGSTPVPAVEESTPSHPDGSPSLSVRGIKNDFSHSDFVPPVREIRFPSDTASLESLKVQDPEGLVTAEYGVVSKLGEGGYGVVFEADQRGLNRPVAVKVLKPKRKGGSKSQSKTGTGSGELQRRRDQFLHEAKITARLQHPNIVPLYDFGINKDGQLFYSMKKVERRPWSSILSNTAKLLDIAESQVNANAEREAITKNVEIFDRVCDAMAYSHAQQVVHRDLKPDNIMIGDYGEVLLIDFGMALDLGSGRPDFSAGGTLVYMAPEMARHFAKQKEIQVAAQRTAKRLGVEQGSVFLDKSNLVGIGKLAEELIQQSQDEGVRELAETLIRLDSEEKELATKIGYTSDIYLLGAILYQIAVGHPPHYFPIAHCKSGKKEKFQKELWLALRNRFQQYTRISDPLRLSLRNIAVRAMKTDPAERFQSVEELQVAIKHFQLQVQSLELVETGREELAKAKAGSGYQHLLPAMESFRGATELWPEGDEAPGLQVLAACEFAKRADKQRDFDAGLSILDEYVLDERQTDTAVVEVRDRLKAGKRRRKRNRTLAAVGWLAAIAIPIGVYGYFAPEIVRQRTEIAKLNDEAEGAQLKAAEAIAEADLKIDEANLKVRQASVEAEAKVREADETAKERIRLADLEANQKIRQANQLAEQRIEQANKSAGEKIQVAEKQAAEQVETAKKQADSQIKLANEQVETARKQAAEYEFDANFGEYNANVLTVPLDLRTGKFAEAARKLDEFKESQAKPYFKNGWAVSHFAKRTAANADTITVGRKKAVRSLLSAGEQKLVASETADGFQLEKIVDGKPQAVSLTLPADSVWKAAAGAAEAPMVAIGLDVSAGQPEPPVIVLLNLESGQQVALDNAAGAIAVHAIALSDDGSQLLSVEELPDERGLSNRGQVVLRSIEDGSATLQQTYLINATTRDLGRPEILATAGWDGDTPVAALAYQTLDANGADVFQLEAVFANAAGKLDSATMMSRELPTAVVMRNRQQMLAGFADGQIRWYQAQDLASGIQELPNENEDAIRALVTTPDGRLFSGSENGTLVVWTSKLEYNKSLNHITGDLTSLAVAPADEDLGIQLISGDAQGNVSTWYPETGRHDAIVRHRSPVTVTSGAVDSGFDAGSVPATAYGTRKGDVYYFNSEDMLRRNRPAPISEQNSMTNATFRFRSPFESFGTAFNDFDSMGIVEDHFVLLRDDGTLFYTLIDESNPLPSAKSGSLELSDRSGLFSRFEPLMASVYNQNYFFTSDPDNDTSILQWRKVGRTFRHQSIDLPSKATGQIKRMALSDNGQWLAVVRAVGKNLLSGNYVVEIYDVAAFATGDDVAIRLAASNERYQVGDPAFVAFAPTNDQLVLHRHKPGVDRETWVEHWVLNGSQWTEDITRRKKIDDRKVAVVDWTPGEQGESLVTKINKNYFLAQPSPDGYSKISFSLGEDRNTEKLRSVRATGTGQSYYVLTNSSLNLFNGTSQAEHVRYPRPIENARHLRVFGDRAVMLDRDGFHLVDANLKHLTKLANRENAVQSVAVSRGRLAIIYANQLCRVWNVSGDRPSGIGEIEGARSVQLSPNGEWAAIELKNSVGIFPIGSTFKEPKFEIAMADASFSWTSGEEAKLLMARREGEATIWETLDPATGQTAVRTDLPDSVEVGSFKIAPITERYIAIESGNQLTLWTVGENPQPIEAKDGFEADRFNGIESFSFSEIDPKFAQPNLNNVGTRLAVLAGEENNLESRLFLLASDTIEVVDEADAGGDPKTAKTRHRVVEIEGALPRRTGLKLLDLKFSGDGKSLIQVDEDGTSTLLSGQ